VARTTKTAATSDEIIAIQDLMADLEERLRDLNSKVKTEASSATSDVNSFVTQALAGISERLRDSAQTVTQSVADEAAKAGTDVLKRIGDEIEHRPLITLAIAAGIGFILGIANRR
jgi:ElaB/YqjD/DUF883 family membrane-anchored ribosome-binding protein